MEGERNESVRFSVSDGRWREVTANLQASAGAIWAYWKKAWETSHQKCDELTRGDGHPLVKLALEQLKGGAKSLIDAYRKDVDAWFDLSRESFKMDCAAMNQLWTAFCGGVDYEPGGADDESQARDKLVLQL